MFARRVLARRSRRAALVSSTSTSRRASRRGHVEQVGEGRATLAQNQAVAPAGRGAPVRLASVADHVVRAERGAGERQHGGFTVSAKPEQLFPVTETSRPLR